MKPLHYYKNINGFILACDEESGYFIYFSTGRGVEGIYGFDKEIFDKKYEKSNAAAFLAQIAGLENADSAPEYREMTQMVMNRAKTEGETV